MAMAAMQAMGCSRATGSAVPTSGGCGRGLESAGLSVVFAQQLRGRGLHSSSSRSCRAASGGRTGSGLGVHAGMQLDDGRLRRVEEGMEMDMDMEMETEVLGDSSGFYEKALLAAAMAVVPLLDVEAASAAGGEFGLVEGRSFALLHPIVMAGLFTYTVYAGYLGWQWRRVRTIQTEITDLKKQVQKVSVAAGDASAPAPPPSPVEAQINSLTEERKELVKGGFRDRHFNAGSILLGLGVFESVGGALNTWFRTGKLFPGPHLFAGATITICWAVAASLVPAMQKGNETARNLHIALNMINVALFVWQIPTGWEIVLKVFEFTKWP